MRSHFFSNKLAGKTRYWLWFHITWLLLKVPTCCKLLFNKFAPLSVVKLIALNSILTLPY